MINGITMIIFTILLQNIFDIIFFRNSITNKTNEIIHKI